VEVAYNDRLGANAWSSYWFNGSIYANGPSGFDIFRLTAGGVSAATRLDHLHPQTEETLLR
jgi:hypothetical protein